MGSILKNALQGHWENTYSKGIGNTLNKITGATSAAELQHEYQKEFAQNAHQWEVKDLEAAGLNPILSAGGQGATASGGGTTGSAGISPISEAIGVLTGITSAQKTNAEAKLAEKQTEEVDATIAEKEANIQNKNADTLLKQAQELSQKLDNEIKAGAKEETIQNTKAQLQETWSRINKNNKETELTEEQIKKIMGGWLAEKMGTGALDAITQPTKPTTQNTTSSKKNYLYKNTNNNSKYKYLNINEW